MVVLDTDILIGILRKDNNAIKKIELLEKTNKRFSTTSINTFELYYGALKSKHPVENLISVKKLLSDIQILEFDNFTASISAEFKLFLEKKGKPTQLLDLFIGSITRSSDDFLITKNKKHFKNIPDLKIESW